MTHQRRDREAAGRRAADRQRQLAPDRQPRGSPGGGNVQESLPQRPPPRQAHAESRPRAQQGAGPPPAPVQPPQGGQPTAGQEPPPGRGRDLVPVPAVDVLETDGEVTVLVDLPGCEEEDIRIRAENDQLTLVAERRDDLTADATALQRERPTSFRRIVAIPTEADIEGASARYDAGVCIVTFPKSERRRQREIGFQ